MHIKGEYKNRDFLRIYGCNAFGIKAPNKILAPCQEQPKHILMAFFILDLLGVT